MSVSSIETRILGLLKSMSTIDSSKVFIGHSSRITGYPRCKLVFIGQEADRLTTRQNQVRYEFEISAYQEYDAESQGSSKAEQILRGVADELEDTFYPETVSAAPLSGTCDFVDPIIINTIATEDAENKVMRLTATLFCTKLVGTGS